jgi:hypothetical protein
MESKLPLKNKVLSVAFSNYFFFIEEFWPSWFSPSQNFSFSSAFFCKSRLSINIEMSQS